MQKNKSQLTIETNNYIKPNGTGAITGDILNTVLIDYVDSFDLVTTDIEVKQYYSLMTLLTFAYKPISITSVSINGLEQEFGYSNLSEVYVTSIDGLTVRTSIEDIIVGDKLNYNTGYAMDTTDLIILKYVK